MYNLFIIFIIILIISLILYYNNIESYNDINDTFINVNDTNDDMKLDLNICSTKCCKHTQYLPDYLKESNDTVIYSSNVLNDSIIQCATDDNYLVYNNNNGIAYNNSNKNYSCSNYDDKTYTKKSYSDEYIPSNFSCDGGCVCMKNKNFNFLANRGYN